MKTITVTSLIAALLFTLQGCSTLYNTKTIDIEILVPGKAKIPSDYKKLAVQYNNCNVGWNSNFARYVEDKAEFIDYSNSDSVASMIYYGTFVDHLSKQQFFDTIIERKPIQFSGVALSDSLVMQRFNAPDTLDSVGIRGINPAILKIAKLTGSLIPADSSKRTLLLIDPDFGLQTKNKIEKIASETGADLFLSFDFFAMADGIFSSVFINDMADSLLYDFLAGKSQSNTSTTKTSKNKRIGGLGYDLRYASEIVYVVVNWNIYDLKKKELTHFYHKIDTISWEDDAYNIRQAKKNLPPRKDAMYNAAAMAATGLAEYFSPHWVNVQRMYYQSGQTELKQTDEMVANNQWNEAAKIWKSNVNNKNKKIAAKSMYNMALVCELNGELDAAMDWVIKSYHVLPKQNEMHAFNTQQYIRILAQRKLDIRKIEN
jgi:hypothetical protein